jgi:hypothetical protein
MSWELIRSVQKMTDMRLILPFGLNVQIGDIISVNKRDGSFQIEGSTPTILGLTTGSIRPPQDGVHLFHQSGNGTSIRFRAEGEASTLFDTLPKASAGFDISFASANDWLLAVVGRKVWQMELVAYFRNAVLWSHHYGVWQPGWALVTGIGVTERMTLLASNGGNTSLSLGVSGQITAGTPMEAQLTAGIEVLAANSNFTQRISMSPQVAFCSAIKVTEGFLRDPRVDSLSPLPEKIAASAEAGEFWTDAFAGV